MLGNRTRLLFEPSQRGDKLVGHFFNKLIQCRPVASRYDELLANYEGSVQLAAVTILLR